MECKIHHRKVRSNNTINNNKNRLRTCLFNFLRVMLTQPLKIKLNAKSFAR